jgi:multidrug efflux system outer membrane protein
VPRFSTRQTKVTSSAPFRSKSGCLIWACATACLLVACADAPKYERPALPVPAVWSVNTDASAPANALRGLAWQVYFTDPRLRSLIALALENNRDLKIAAARVLEARAQYGIAKADRLPSLSAFGKADYEGIPASLNTGALTSQRVDANVSSISYEVDFWGRIASLTEAAKASFFATEEAQRSVQLGLIADVANTYYAVVQFDELVRLAEITVASRAQTHELMGRGKDLGGAYDFEFRQTQGLLESARVNLEGLKHQRQIAVNQLQFLVGATPQDLPEGQSLFEQGLELDIAPGLPADVLLYRPDVIAAEERLMAAHANIHAARAAFLPKVALTATLGLASTGLGTLFANGAWAFQPILSMPLFDGGRTAAGVDIAQARKVIAVAEYERIIQQAFREVADQLSARAAMANQLKSALLNVQAQERRLEIATARNQAGLASFLEVLDAERDVTTARQTMVQIRKAQLESATLLYKALGGGTQSPEKMALKSP